MKKTIVILLILSLALLYARPGVNNIEYDQNGVMSFGLKSGEFSKTSRVKNDVQKVEYSSEFTSQTVEADDHYYQRIQLPIAISDKLPSVRVMVKSTIGFEHEVKNNELYELSDVRRFRDQDFVYLSINPFLANDRVATEFKILIDMGSSYFHSDADKYDTYFLNKKFAASLNRNTIKPSLNKTTTSFDGEWLNIVVSDEGIFSISFDDLTNAGVTESISDDNVYLFAGPGFGSHLRDQYPDSSDFHLKQVPMLFMEGSGDNPDKWVFYASQPSAWRRMEAVGDIRFHDFVRVPYEDNQVFKLFVGDYNEAPQRIQQDIPQFSGSEEELDYFYQRLHHEVEAINPGKGGELWLGEKLKANNTYEFYLNNLYTAEVVNAYVRLSVGMVTPKYHNYSAFVNSKALGNFSDSIFSNADDEDRIDTLLKQKQYKIDNSDLSENTDVRINFNGSLSTTESFLDYIDIIYPANPVAIDGKLDLWFKENVLDQKIRVSGLNASLSYVFNIEDPFNTTYFPVSGSYADVLIPASTTTSSFLVLNETHFKAPASISLYPDFEPSLYDDHAQQTDLLIITPDQFYSEAQRLADFKETRPQYPLTTQVKTYKEILDQFNAGNNDPYAIWHYVTNMYAMAPDPKPQYVLLVGDGHFDYQNKLYSAQNFIPYLYEPKSLWPCDDIFVMVNSRQDKTNDLAIGRIPANSTAEVKYVVDKIIHYDSRIEQGEWQLNSMLVADDPSDPPQGGHFFDQTEFIRDSEVLVNNFIPKTMQVKRVYLSDYPERYITELQTTGRDGAREDMMEAFLNGVSYVNYYGHGDPSVWSQEKVFIKNDLVRLEVNKQYPMVTGATCSWGRSDNPDYQSMAEEMVTMEENGAIATLSTVRAVYHDPNKYFIEDFMTGLFSESPAERKMMGDAVLYAKVASSGMISLPSKESNNLRFMYFGDPSIIPAFPQNSGVIDSVSRDTLRALDKVWIEGQAIDLNSPATSGNTLHGKITVYDNDYQVVRNYLDRYGNTRNISFYLEGNRLFNGDIEFDGDEFSTEVFIPKDIQYNGTEGKIRVMYWNEDGLFDGAGVLDGIHVGGINPNAALDQSGPEIDLFVSDVEIFNGSIVYDTSKIKISFEDISGVNITGSSGHILEMNIDNGQQVVDLSELFSYEDNGYAKGAVEFYVGNYLDEGEHLIEICAYDNYNNYSEVEIMLNVIAEDGDVVDNLVNFPNPFKASTDITFSSLFAATANLRVYTISGKKVYDEENISIDPGFNAIPFTAEDEYGHKLAAGVYFYVIEIDNGMETIKQHSKMVVLP